MGENKSISLEERIAKLEEAVDYLSDKTEETERKMQAIFKRIEELRDHIHTHELNMVSEIKKIEGIVVNLSQDLKWYGKFPTLIVSSLNFIITVLILLKLMGVLKVGG